MTTELFLLIHLFIFILNLSLAFLLMKLQNARVTLWCLILIAITPLFNIALLFLLIYELVISFIERWRR